MTGARTLLITLCILAAWVFAKPAHSLEGLDVNTVAALETEKEIYISTKRKSGEWSEPAPVWFDYENGIIYSTTSPNSHKAKRINDGRRKVRISVGHPNGPTFTGIAQTFTDSAIVSRMAEAYDNKYWISWFGFFRPRVDRVETGKTIAYRVTPQTAN